jgi:Uma2 family endonuclease
MTSSAYKNPIENIALKNTIPALEDGDRLTQSEFERRYDALPHLKKAELIAGIVYMASPLRIIQHGEPHGAIMTWLGIYKALTSGVQLGDNCTVRLDGDNEPQPDALLRIEVGGQSNISKDGYVEGAPELIAEVAASSVSIDMHDKLEVYRRNQVQEYIVWRFEDGELDWFRLTQGKYILLDSNLQGIIKSEVFPGLWLDKQALLAGNLTTVIEIVQQGLTTIEHQNFVQQLSDRKHTH